MKATTRFLSPWGLTPTVIGILFVTSWSGSSIITGVRAETTLNKLWKKIEFFTSTNGSIINETMSQMDEIEPSPEPTFVCPTLQSDVICSTDWDPYICGTHQCEYSNDCVARNSGFNITTQCQKASEPSTEVPATEDASSSVSGSSASNCPTQQNPDLFCTTHWDPYECGIHKCRYGNDCEALVAGFNVTTHCTRVGSTNSSSSSNTTSNTAFDCPVFPPDLFCEEVWQPYLCVDQCQYTNDCYATASGFNVTSDCIALPV